MEHQLVPLTLLKGFLIVKKKVNGIQPFVMECYGTSPLKNKMFANIA